MRPFRSLLWSAVGAWLVLLAAGCGSPSGRTAERLPPQPLLFGRTTFFEGSITADALLGPFRLAPSGGLDRTPPRPGDGETIPVQDGRFGDRGTRDPGTGFPRGLQEEGAFGSDQQRIGRRGRTGGSLGTLPRQTLTVTFRSQSDQPVAVGVVEVRSALGNFVPIPEQFKLAPGATQELETMRASYPAAIDELELLVTLRSGGKTETQVVKLRLAEPRAAR